MAKCINTKHPEFVSLVDELGFAVGEVEIATMSFQKQTGTDGFPPATFVKDYFKEEELHPSDKRIMNALQNSGIEVTTIEDYKARKKKKGEEVPDGAGSIADLTENIIALRKGEDLREEAAHFAIAIAEQDKTRAFRRAYRNVVNHKLYKEMKSDYEQFGMTEHEYRLEIMGKIASGYAYDNNYPRGSMPWYLTEILNWVKEKLSGFYGYMGKKVATGNLDISKIKDSKYKFYSAKKVSYDKIKRELDNAQAFLKKKYLNADRSTERYERAKVLNMQLELIKEQADHDRGIIKMIKFLEEDLTSVINDIEESSNQDMENRISLSYIREFLDFYQPILDMIDDYLLEKKSLGKTADMFESNQDYERYKLLIEDDISDLGIVAKGFNDLQKVGDKLADLKAKFSRQKRWYLIKNRQAVEKRLHRWAEETISDPEKLRLEKEKISNNLSSVEFDSSLGNFWMGSLKDSKSLINRLMYSKMKDINYDIREMTRGFAEKLLSKRKELGIDDPSRIYNKDTHHYIRPYDQEAYEKAKDEAFQKIHKAVGLSPDRAIAEEQKALWREYIDMVKYYKKYDDVAKKHKFIYQKGNTIGFSNNWVPADTIYPVSQFLKSDVWQRGNAMIEYGKMASEFYQANTKDRPDAEQIKQSLIDKWGENSSKYRSWAANNIGYTINGREYFRNDMVIPDPDKYSNELYEDLPSNYKEYLDFVIKQKMELDLMIPFATDMYRRPQIKSDWVNSIIKKGRLREAFKEGFNMVVDSDDVEFGEMDPIRRADGSIARFVPTHFIKKVENPSVLSTDVESDLILYAQMAHNFQKKAAEVKSFEQVLDAISDRDVEFDRKRSKGKETVVYKAMEQFIEQHLYGMYKIRSENDTFTILGKTFSKAKLMHKVNRYITHTNLAFKMSTVMTGTLTSQFNLGLERLVNTYIGKNTYRNAANIYRQHVHHALREAGNPVKTNKMSRVFQTHYVLQDTEQQFSRLDIKSDQARKFFRAKGYYPYEIAEHGIKGTAAIAMMVSMRLHDGTFRTSRELEAMGVENYEELPTYWQAINEDGTSFREDLTITNPLQERKNMTKKIEDIINRADGRLSMEDRAHLHRHFLWQLLATHRGWIPSGFATRFKTLGQWKEVQHVDPETGKTTTEKVWQPGLNYTTGEYEEGFYTTTWQFLRQTIFSKERMGDLKNLIAQYNELETWQKDAVNRAIYEAVLTSMFMTFMTGLNYLAAEDDEEENYMLQYAAYVNTRVFLEITALQAAPIGGIKIDNETGRIVPEFSVLPPVSTQLIEVLQSPIAGVQQLNTILELANLWEFGEEVQSGPYEGLTKGERFLLKSFPGLKGISGDRDPAASNQYLKYKALKWLH